MCVFLIICVCVCVKESKNKISQMKIVAIYDLNIIMSIFSNFLKSQKCIFFIMILFFHLITYMVGVVNKEYITLW